MRGGDAPRDTQRRTVCLLAQRRHPLLAAKLLYQDGEAGAAGRLRGVEGVHQNDAGDAHREVGVQAQLAIGKCGGWRHGRGCCR